MARRYIISGRVQGVAFRYFVRQHALDLELTGWVRNLSDGRVEACAQGAAEALAALRRSLEAGPSQAIVSAVEEAEAEPLDADTFIIRRTR